MSGPLSAQAPGAVQAGGWRFPGRGRALAPGQGWCDLAAGEAGMPPGDASAVLEGLFEHRPTAWLRRMPGRETLAWPDAAGTWVLKRFLADDGREAWAELLGLRARRSPGRREGENLLALAADGFDVPRVRGWWEERNPGGGLGAQRFARSAVLMERVEHTQHLRQALERDASATMARWGGELARMVARLHERGWYHRDLYLQHLIPSAKTESLVLIDVGRARRQVHPRRRWFVKDLAALLHSTPDAVGARARLRVFAAYCDARGLHARAERRALARAVQVKAGRLAAHAPRHTDPSDRGVA